MNKYRSYQSYIEEKLLYDAKQQFRIKCKCGHTCTILSKKGYQICSWCHNYVFINPKIEFEYRMKEKLNKEKRNKNER